MAVVLVTAPSARELEALGERLVGERLAACVSVVPGVTSIYRWDEAVETASEALGIIKTTMDRLAELEARVVALHPYEVPEILALQPVTGSGRYVEWVRESVTAGRSGGPA